MDVRVGLWRRLSTEELMLLNCGVGEDSWESLGQWGDPTSPLWRRSALGVLWKEWCWSWNSSTLATSCEELTHWKRLWCWEGLGAGGKGDDRGWDGWMASRTRWTWVWVNSGSWWWTGRPGVLRFMGSQRVGHDWATELNWTELMGPRLVFLFTRCSREKGVCVHGHVQSPSSAWLCNPMDCSLSGSCLWDFSGKNTGVGYHFLLQGIFSTQGWYPHLLHWQVDSLQWSHLEAQGERGCSQAFTIKDRGGNDFFLFNNFYWTGRGFLGHPTCSRACR